MSPSESRFMPRRSKSLAPAGVSLFLATTLGIAPRNILASEEYSGKIAQFYGMPCPPACTLCHTRADGGLLTATTPFGTSARRAGLFCCDPSSVSEVLNALQVGGNDSDLDGTSDTDELSAGSDPNGSGENLACAPPAREESGCTTVSGTRLEGEWLGAIGWLVACSAWLRRAKVRQRSRRFTQGLAYPARNLVATSRRLR